MTPAPALRPHHRILDLAGRWELTEAGGGEPLPAQVPGCVHTDLIAAGRLPPLWWRDNELEHQWPCERDWTYTRTIDVDADLLARDRVWLRCDGLDTLAEITVNDVRVLSADNMHRIWEADLKPALRLGANTVRVQLRSVLPVIAAKDAERHLPAWNTYAEAFRGKSWVRKMACAFGWDWGPMVPTAGIWRGICVHAADHGRLEAVRVQQHHQSAGVTLAITAAVEQFRDDGLTLHANAAIDGAVVATTKAAVDGPLALHVAKPQLWWPNGAGAQPLYTVRVELRAADGGVVDVWERRIGLRTLTLVREEDQWGESFAFAVNGVRLFAKGANWIPCDIFPSQVTRATYANLLGSAAEAGMNMIRAWGGGIYENDDFYDCCDELGLLVWQDFAFACATYPTFDPAFMANVRQEAIDNIRRLRHHPCIALWCGNNELEQGLVDETWTASAMSWPDYAKLFDRLLPDLVAAEHGEAPYWPCSPHSPYGNRRNFNNDRCGDAHAWSVWFGGQSFESQREWTYRFQSEFGFQSFPEPRTVAAFTEPHERQLNSYVMDYHQRSKTQGNKTIFAYLLDWFLPPKDLDATLWLSQLTQALCVQYAAEHSRRIQPRMEGCLYWQINDMWPAATWSSIDVFGRWKALQHFAKCFFAPVLVSGLEDLRDDTVAVHVSNHRPEPLRAEVRWRVTDAAGVELAAGHEPVTVASQTNVHATTIACAAFRRRLGTADRAACDLKQKAHGILGQFAGDRDLLVWTAVVADGEVLSRNLTCFARPKHLLLTRPSITTTVQADGDAFAITLRADRPALWTRLELRDTDVRFSDNFFHLDGQETITVRCVPGQPLSLTEVQARLMVSSLVDLG